MDTLYLKYLRAYITYLGIQRIDEYLFPRDAVREAILNALIHKDYSQANAIQVKVFESKLHIYNPGRLPDGWTLDNLLSKHPSVPFNPLIAEAFFCAGEIEHWGRGIEKIITLCTNAHLAKPLYEHHGMVGLFLDATAKLAELQKHLDLKPGTAVLNQNLLSGQTGGQTGGQTRQRILSALAANPQATTGDLASMLRLSRSAIMKHIKCLKAEGRLRRVGPDFGGHWEVNQ